MPPTHHASCSTVSDRPNADARDSSGRSSWITASRLILASALAVAPIRPTIAAVASPGSTVATSAASTQPATHPTITWSGEPKCSREPSALPRNPPAPAATPITPSRSSCMNGLCPLCSVCAFTANAANIIRNPVSTRTEPLPHNATTM